MAIRLDPEENETRALLDLGGDELRRAVLEIGCGYGRLTARYAGGSARVLAIDPNADWLEVARRDVAPHYPKVELRSIALGDLPLPPQETFDLALLSWSL